MKGHSMTAVIWAKDILDCTSLKDVSCRYEIDARDINLRANSFTSKWEDEDMLVRGVLSAFNSNTDDINVDARKQEEEKKSKILEPL